MNPQRVSQINNIIFTPREIDVIACIINVRGVKKIGDILGISHRTVESYIKTILRKISSNSQEAIKDFVEKSSELVLLKQHYIDLLINKLFLSQIAKVAAKLKNKNISCVVSQAESEKLEYISSCLKSANINITITEKSSKIPINGSNQKTITVLTEEHLLQLKQAKKIDNTIFICFDKRLRNDFLQKFSYIQIVDCFENDQIYSAIFKIIELLALNIDLHDSISIFNKQKNNVINLKIDLKTILLDVDEEIKEKTLTRKTIMTVTLISIVIICTILSISILIYKNYYSSTNISVNFLLPNKKILLQRKIATDQLDKIFSKPNEISIAVLIGVGGSGKTTIAINYASRQKASIIWEINAETKNSLSLSLEGLAYSLCKNNSDKQELRNILDIKDFANKDRQLLLFTQKQLKLISNWFIIYDNVESFKDILEYFPYNAQSWGSGRVIITTRDATIKNNSYIDNKNIINVEEINKKEKLELFKNIISDSLPQSAAIETTIEQFLENIPSFPLDVSIAAHYLRDTGLDYNKYLEEIKTPRKEFTELQTSILQDVNQYTKTRYNIVSLTLQNMIKLNPEFFDLALLIALLDSQDIPEEFLVFYKNQYIASSFLRNLKKNSLITNIQYKNDNKKDIDHLTKFSIHRSTQANILADIIESLEPNNKKKLLKSIINSLEQYISNLIETEDIIRLKVLQNHCKAILIHGKDILDSEAKILLEVVLGEISYYLGYDLKAKQMLEETILRSNQSSTKIAVAYSSLGNIYRRLGDFKKAKNSFEKSLEIYNQFPEQKLQIAKTSMYLGTLYRVMGEDIKAKNSFEKSLEIYNQFPEQKLQIAKTSMYLGTLYRIIGNYEMAQELLEKSFNVYNEPCASKIGFARISVHLAVFYRVIGEYKKAIDLLESSLNIYKQLRKPDHIDIAWVTAHLGVVFGKDGHNIKAMDLLESSLKVYKKHFGEQHIETARIMNYLAEIYILREEFDKAEVLINSALQIFQTNNHYESYISLELLGDIYASKAKHDKNKFHIYKQKATNYFNEALKIANTNFPQNSKHTERLRIKLQPVI